jgi:hypothetical protein
MRVLSVSDVLGMSDGEIIPALKCRVKAVFDHKSGTNSNGEWAIQNIIVDDAAGAEIKVKVCDKDELPKSIKGKWVHFVCYKGDKGLSGVKVAEDTYKGRTALIVKVTKSADIETGEVEASAPATEPPANRVASHQAAPATKAELPKQNGNGNGNVPVEERVNAVKVWLGRRANGMSLCLAAADYLNEQYLAKHNEPMSAEQYQAITSSLFIAGDRAGQFDALPAGPLKNLAPETAH